MAFVIFLALGVVPVCAGWVLTWPLRSLPIGPLRFLPLVPGALLAAPLTAAGIYQYQEKKELLGRLPAPRTGGNAGILLWGFRCADAGVARIRRGWLPAACPSPCSWAGGGIHILRDVLSGNRRVSQSRSAFSISRDPFMPTYEYSCQKCGKTFEVFQSMKDARSRPAPAARRARSSACPAEAPESSSRAAAFTRTTTGADRQEPIRAGRRKGGMAARRRRDRLRPPLRRLPKRNRSKHRCNNERSPWFPAKLRGRNSVRVWLK